MYVCVCVHTCACARVCTHLLRHGGMVALKGPCPRQKEFGGLCFDKDNTQLGKEFYFGLGLGFFLPTYSAPSSP